MAGLVFVQNSNLFRLEGLHEVLNTGVAGDYLNAETVVITILDADGVEVAGATWPETMTYVTASNGDYAYVLPNTVTLVRNSVHKAFIEVEAIGFHCEFPFTPITRTGVTTTS